MSAHAPADSSKTKYEPVDSNAHHVVGTEDDNDCPAVGLLRLNALPERLVEDPPHVSYGDESVCDAFRSRVGWLGLFLIGLWSAAFIIDAFEKTLQANTHPAVSNIHMTCTCTRTPAPPPSAHTHTQHAYRAEVTYPRRESLLSVPIPSIYPQANVELAHFVPLIIGQGGNAGSQAAPCTNLNPNPNPNPHPHPHPDPNDRNSTIQRPP